MFVCVSGNLCKYGRQKIMDRTVYEYTGDPAYFGRLCQTYYECENEAGHWMMMKRVCPPTHYFDAMKNDCQFCDLATPALCCYSK